MRSRVSSQWSVVSSEESLRLRTTDYGLRTSHAFTLIELMVVVSIMLIVVGMSAPPMVRMLKKEGMRKAVSDVVEVCSNARAQAILQGVTTEVVFFPKEGRLEISAAASPAPRSENLTGPVETTRGLVEPVAFAPAAPAASGSGHSAQLPEKLAIELLDINLS